MKYFKISLLIGTAFLFLSLSWMSDPLPEPFVHLMERAKMTFDAPDSMAETTIKNNSQMNYEYALANPGKHFEVRYAIRPLDSMLAKYNRDTAQKAPGSFSADPNKLHNALLQATLFNIFGGHLPQIKTFNPAAVKSEFNADWGAVAAGHPAGDFGAGYQSCMVVAIHKDGAGNAYYFYLADSTVVGPDFGKLMKRAFHSLRFKDE